MNVAKKYKRGGFFGNSQERFSDMEGAGRGINMAYADRGLLKTKGAALRREKRYLKKLAEQGKLGTMGPQSQDRLDYLRNVQKDRAKKGVAAGALAAAAALGGPALLSALKSGGLSGIAGKKGLFKGASKAMEIQKALGDSGVFRGAEQNPDSGQYGNRSTAIEDMQLGPIQDFDMPEEDFDSGKYGMKILKAGGLVGGQKRLDKNNDGRLTREDFELLRAMLGAKLPR